MSSDRVDRLLEEALARGEVPAGASPEDGEEVKRLLASASVVRGAASRIDDEACLAMPTARARFQRYVAASATPARAVVARPARRGFFAWLFETHRAFALAGASAAIGVAAVVVVFVSQDAISGTETAAAQVLTPGDYVQVEGVVSQTSGEGDDRVVQVQSEFTGDLKVALSSNTAVVDEQASQANGQVGKGDRVLVSGVVRKDRSIAAQTVAFARNGGATPPRIKVRQLKELRAALDGRVTFLGVAEDGTGRVLVDAGNGARYIVPVDAASMRKLIESGATAVGARVSVRAAANAGKAFSLEVQAAPSPGAGAGPAVPTLSRIAGVVLGREGNQLRVETLRGPVTVVIRPDTRILVGGNSGLTLADAAHGDAARGHEVVVSGGLKQDRFVADVIAIGPKPAR